MIIRTERFTNNGDSTLSLVRVDSVFECFGLEDPPRSVKIAGITRIPAGVYDIKLRTEGGMHSRYSKAYPNHRGMLWLQDVPDFEWVYYHIANFAAEVEGCIGVGAGIGDTGKDRWMVTSSKNAYLALYDKVVASAEAGTLQTHIINNDGV